MTFWAVERPTIWRAAKTVIHPRSELIDELYHAGTSKVPNHLSDMDLKMILTNLDILNCCRTPDRIDLMRAFIRGVGLEVREC